MSTSIVNVEYSCDWADEHGDVCGYTQSFNGNHEEAARAAGWGWYSNAYVRWSRWGVGAAAWFCPTHAIVFGNNHGWGGLEAYGPPHKWWRKLTRRRR